MYAPLAVARTEVLIRIFFRAPGAPTDTVNLTDFDRRPKVRGQKEGGLSFCRSGLMTYKDMAHRTRTREPGFARGFSYIHASTLIDRGYSFYGKASDPGHVCMHCELCNNLMAACFCTGRVCPLDPSDLAGDDEEREFLSSIARVLFDAKLIADVERIFGHDVDETDITKANATYVDRWQEDRYRIFQP